jgi:hypothetical protein
MPFFWSLADRVFSGKLDREDRIRILFGEIGFTEGEIRFLTVNPDREEALISEMTNIPADLPVYRGVGFLGMIVSGLSLLDEGMFMRRSETICARKELINKDGLPSLRQMVFHYENLKSETVIGKRVIATSLRAEDHDHLTNPKKAMIISPKNISAMSRDPVTGCARGGIGKEDWCIVLAENRDDDLHHSEPLSESVHFSSDPARISGLIRGRMPILFSAAEMQEFMALQENCGDSTVKSYHCALLAPILNDIDEEYGRDIFDVAVGGVTAMDPPISSHAFIAQWPTLPARWMLEMGKVALMFREECIRLSLSFPTASDMIVGPCLCRSEEPVLP